MAGKSLKLNKEDILAQLERLATCAEDLEQSRKTVEILREGQDALLWTGDGKSVALVAALRQRYKSSRDWIDDLLDQVKEAKENLLKLQEETEEMDSEHSYTMQNLVYRIDGSLARSRNIPI